MIGRLSGTIAAVERDCAIVDVAGVGYEVYMPTSDLAALSVGVHATLVIETVVREDLIRLYGFRAVTERDWFRLLQGVQGVGAKVALAVLSTLPGEALASAIAMGDKVAIARAPGVGKRVAERIATELSGKGPAAVTMAPATSRGVPAERDATLADAVSALANLGYDPSQAHATVAKLRASEPDAGAAELIRLGLKALAA